MGFSEILNILLGGGLVALVVAIATMRATVRKANADAERANADAEKARADAESVRITNTENATRILVENIVKPLKDELHATREELQATKREMASTKREMARLRKAVEAASGCRHSDGCPVLARLRDNQKEPGGGVREPLGRGADRHDIGCEQTDNDADNTGEPGEPDNLRGQPP